MACFKSERSKVTNTEVPPSGVDCTRMRPWCRAVMRSQVVSPMPVPLNSLRVWNRWNR